ncbi:MAG: hypothetical protein COA69_02025 [Robiginitomaculum sp.]|nr:MAG: hypothetical protein COA69_02025 [Robiginitomaculum sp.]
MKNEYHIALGWGLALSVSLTAILGLPMLAGASAVLQNQVAWQLRVQDFENTDLAQVGRTSLVSELAQTQLDRTITSPWMLDMQMNMESTSSAQDLVAQAKSTRQQVQCLSEAVYYEARSENSTGQKAVAEVVLNRVKNKHFPNTICSVVYEGAERTTGCQFSFACDGSTAQLPSGKSWEHSKRVAEHMIMGASAPMTWRATHYHTTGVAPKWAPMLRQTRQYETHVFYRFMPRKSTLRTVSVAP